MARRWMWIGMVGALLLPLIISMSSGRAAAAVCQGYSTLVQVGRQARVVPGFTGSLRAQPSSSAAEVASIPGGGIVTVLGGAECSEGLTWWRVRYRANSGWLIEGQGSEHRIDRNLSSSSAPATPVNGVSGTSAQVLYNYYGACVLTGTQTVALYDSNLLPSGAFIPYSIADEEKPPLICVTDPSSAFALAPDGSNITPVVEENFGTGNYVVFLPDWAYTIPGVWQFGAGGVTVQVNVMPAPQPFMRVQEIAAGNDPAPSPTAPALLFTPAPLRDAILIPAERIMENTEVMGIFIEAEIVAADEMQSLDTTMPVVQALAQNTAIIDAIASENGTMEFISDTVAVIEMPIEAYLASDAQVDNRPRTATVTLAGFMPNEAVILVSGTATRERGSLVSSYSDVTGTLVQVDDAGFFIGEVNSQGPIFAALGQSRQLAQLQSLSSTDGAVLDQLYRAFFPDVAPVLTDPPQPALATPPLYYYSSGTGNTVVGRLSNEGQYSDSAYPPQMPTGYTHLFGLGNGQVMYYDANSGAGEVVNISAAEMPFQQSYYGPGAFTTLWTHIVYDDGSGQVIFYRSSDGLTALVDVSPEGSVNTLASYTINPGWTAVAATEGWYIFYNAADGSYESLQFYPDGTWYSTGLSASGGFSPDWSHIIGYQGRLLFYNQFNGWVAWGHFQDGFFSQVTDYGLTPGWTHLVPVGNRMLFYNANAQTAEVGSFQDDGSYLPLQTGMTFSAWTNITAPR